jgi:hypothetical protein
MQTDVLKLQQIMSQLRQALLMTAGLSNRADDLESLLSVAESEAKRVYMAAVGAGTGSVAVILSDGPAEEPKSSG